jgi:multidrug efflux pump subunit AcrA (membrane-fusion protein)
MPTTISHRRSEPAFRSALVIAILSGACILAAGCKHGETRPPQDQDRPPTLVTAADVIARDVPVYLDEIGRCTAFQSVSIKPQVTGSIVKIKFTDGQDVKRGQVLFEIDPRPYQAALAQANAQLAQATAQLGLAKVDFNRIKDLPRRAAERF